MPSGQMNLFALLPKMSRHCTIKNSNEIFLLCVDVYLLYSFHANLVLKLPEPIKSTTVIWCEAQGLKYLELEFTVV
jgi:hypothetical protein